MLLFTITACNSASSCNVFQTLLSVIQSRAYTHYNSSCLPGENWFYPCFIQFGLNILESPKRQSIHRGHGGVKIWILFSCSKNNILGKRAASECSFLFVIWINADKSKTWLHFDQLANTTTELRLASYKITIINLRNLAIVKEAQTKNEGKGECRAVRAHIRDTRYLTF